MTTAFDPLKAAREELAGLNDLYRRLQQRERRCEEALAIAEADLNDIRKIISYVRINMDIVRARIVELERDH